MANKPYVIVVGTDYSAPAFRAVRAAAYEASKHPSAELHVVHVVSAVEPHHELPSIPFAGFGNMRLEDPLSSALAKLDAHLAAALTGLEIPANVVLRTHVLPGEPAQALMDLAWELWANLTVIGTRGRRHTSSWALGVVAETVVRHATSAVLVIGPRVQVAPERSAKIAPS